MATTNYEVNYDDERFSQVERDKEEALSNLENTYDDMISKSDQYYQEQIDASKDWAERQQQLQQEKTDFAIEKIEQQKAQANKDYLKEQSGAYVDWQKQSNKYGANAEAIAAQGLAGSGYSESSQVSMYNTYQNRIASARESYQNAVLNYNNAITEARMQNNALLAEIAYNAFQQQLELSLQSFQYKNSLVLDKTAKMLEADQMYYSRYQDVLAQINHENSMAEQIRQYNESLAEDKRQFDASLAEEQRRYNAQQAADSSQSLIIDKGNGNGNGNGEKPATKTPPATKKTNAERIADDMIDMESVRALGYGDISAAKLSELEEQGIVESYYGDDGRLKFRKKKKG